MLYSAEPIWIVGYGKFGRRAVDRIIKDKHPPPPVTVIDSGRKDDIHEEIKYVQADGVKWFVDNLQKIGKVAVITIKSHQFAPGVGGFYTHELLSILSQVRRNNDNSILLCTACKCHGIVTSFQLLG